MSNSKAERCRLRTSIGQAPQAACNLFLLPHAAIAYKIRRLSEKLEKTADTSGCDFRQFRKNGF
ncbi:MAG: hypothetical protein KL801_01765 [Mesorhizobium sp.]|nr:hypothetical protein [Mesorhizobium sp.]